MRLPPRRELIANNRPHQLLLAVATFGSAAAFAVYYLRTIGVPTGLGDGAAFVGCLALAGALGLFTGGLVAIFVMGPLYYSQGIENGAPYEPGDTVFILAGPHQGRRVRVYAVWSERNQVRVELGDAERDAVTDVFSYHEVCRDMVPPSWELPNDADR